MTAWTALTPEQRLVWHRMRMDSIEPAAADMKQAQAEQLAIDGFFFGCDFEGVDRPREWLVRAVLDKRT